MTFSYHDITEFYVFVTNSKGKMKNGKWIFKIVYDFGCYLEAPEEND